METYLAYFDILGFKNFILNNKGNEEKVNKFMDNLFRDSQTAMSDKNYVDGSAGTYIPNVDLAQVNCLHISDSIIFWTKDANIESFEKIIKSSLAFLNYSTFYSFPVRGCIVYGNIEFDPFEITNKNCVFL